MGVERSNRSGPSRVPLGRRRSPPHPAHDRTHALPQHARSGARVLAARAGARGDPAGGAARAAARRRAHPHAALGRQPPHRGARVPRRPATVPTGALPPGGSRGTEALVFRGGVPPSQHAVMRAPFQEGDFPGPVKYGYLNVGAVEQGPPELSGRTVFCLYPHQTAYVVPASAVAVVPEGVPPARAVLAGTVETAVNALWDAAPLLGDRVTVV